MTRDTILNRTYQDLSHILEAVYSNPTAPKNNFTGNPSIYGWKYAAMHKYCIFAPDLSVACILQFRVNQHDGSFE